MRHEPNSGSAKSEGFDGAQGVLGGSNGTAAKREEQETPAGMPATACSSSPAMVATSISLKTFGSASLHISRHGVPNRKSKRERARQA